jgi:hypothetical protein
MALHTTLQIFQVTYALLDRATDLTKNMPRDYKSLLGAKIRDECVELTVLIFRANTSRDKVPHLTALLERLQVVELLLRLCADKKLIGRGEYAKAVLLTQQIGRQASGWRKHSAASPAA